MEKNISKIIIDKVIDKSKSFVKACCRPNDESHFIIDEMVEETYVDQDPNRRCDCQGSTKPSEEKI